MATNVAAANDDAVVSNPKRKVWVEKITPEKAALWLKKNIRESEQVRWPASTSLSYAMKKAGFQLGTDAIGFAIDGYIINGQPRLEACVKSGTSFESIVITGLEPTAYKVIDIGRARNLAGFLQMEGCHSAVRVAAAARWLYRIKEGKEADHKQKAPDIALWEIISNGTQTLKCLRVLPIMPLV